MKCKTAVIPVLLLMVSAVPALAVEVEISNDGAVQFYDDSVLGKNTEGTEPVKGRSIRQLRANEQKQLRLQATGEGIKINLEDSSASTSQQRQPETIESQRLRLEIPAQLRESTGQNAQPRNPNRVDQTPGLRQVSDEALKVENEAEAERRRYIQKVRQERRTRNKERVEILKSDLDKNRQQLELHSRDFSAKLRQGAEFVLDPAANTVSITTPSGITHELNHLPDQAIARMLEAGLITDGETNEIEIAPSEDEQTLLYRTTVLKQRRLLGLFERTIPHVVTLNDNTGEVAETEVGADNLIEQVLDQLSF